MDWVPIVAGSFGFLVSAFVVLFIILKLQAKGIDYGWFQFAATVVVFNISFAIIMSVIDFLYSNIDFVISELVTGVSGVVHQTLITAGSMFLM